MPTAEQTRVMRIIESVEELTEHVELAKLNVFEKPHTAAGQMRGAYYEALNIKKALVELAERL